MNSTLHIPKAEIHVHLEATISPELCRKFAKRNKTDISEDLLTVRNILAFHCKQLALLCSKKIEFQEVYENHIVFKVV